MIENLAMDVFYFIALFVTSYFTFFHLILWLENKGKLFEKKKIKNLPSVSIIVPAYNEEEYVGKTIENLLRIAYPKDKLEILVVDDGSKDNTYSVAKKYQSKIVKVFTKPRGGKANAINFGLKLAKNEFVAVMDADSLPTKTALKNCIKYFDEDDVAAVTTNILPKRRSLLEKIQYVELMFVSFLRKLQEFPNIISCTPGPFSVYRKNILKKVGGFDEKNIVEDVEIAWRLLSRGYKVKMAFDSRVDSFYPYSLRVWWKQRTRWGVGGIQTLLKYTRHMFKKDSYGVGNFLVPTSIIGYSFTVLGIGISLYLIVTQGFIFFMYLFKCISVGVNPLNVFSIDYAINSKLIYGVMLFLMFIVMIKITLDAYKIKVNPLLILLYMVVYATLYSFVFLNSIYKYVRKERGWLTK